MRSNNILEPLRDIPKTPSSAMGIISIYPPGLSGSQIKIGVFGALGTRYGGNRPSVCGKMSLVSNGGHKGQSGCGHSAVCPCGQGACHVISMIPS